MPGWAWVVVSGAGWCLAAVLAALFVGAMVRLRDRQVPAGKNGEEEG